MGPSLKPARFALAKGILLLLTLGVLLVAAPSVTYALIYAL